MDKESQPEAEQPKAGKIFFLIFILLIIASVAVVYYRIMIKKDYIIEAQADCDPYTEKCFIWKCDPESSEKGEACTGDMEEDIWYYKVVRRNAGKIPLCNPEDEDCTALVCGEGEPECEQVFCNDENKEAQGVDCSDPVKYTQENPEEEDATCEEGDTECVAEEGDETESADSVNSTESADGTENTGSVDSVE